MAEINKDWQEANRRAYRALLGYEKNCYLKYDDHSPSQRPSHPPQKGERICDYAERYNVTIEQMEQCQREVEKEIERWSKDLNYMERMMLIHPRRHQLKFSISGFQAWLAIGRQIGEDDRRRKKEREIIHIIHIQHIQQIQQMG